MGQLQTHQSGSRNSVYNPDGTLASMTDAKGQKHVYTRDTYKRITSIARFNANGVLRPNDSYSYYHDTNPFAPAFSQNTQGRLAAVQWGSGDTLPGQMTEMYSCHAALNSRNMSWKVTILQLNPGIRRAFCT